MWNLYVNVCVFLCVYQFRNSFICCLFVCQYAKYFTIKIVILWFASACCRHVHIFLILIYLNVACFLPVWQFLSHSVYDCISVLFILYLGLVLLLLKFALPHTIFVLVFGTIKIDKMQNQIIPIIRQAAECYSFFFLMKCALVRSCNMYTVSRSSWEEM